MYKALPHCTFGDTVLLFGTERLWEEVCTVRGGCGLSQRGVMGEHRWDVWVLHTQGGEGLLGMQPWVPRAAPSFDIHV